MKGELIENVRSKAEYAQVFEDIVMLIIVVANLLFVAFDWSFGFAFVQRNIELISYDFFVYYRDVIHPDFLLYDSVFILIFVSEILIQWILSIVFKSYSRWWLYPFVNWYDVLGCIPIGAFRWLRLLRIGALMIRLHKMGVIDMYKTFFYRKFYELYQIFVREVADRALIVMVDAMQRGVKSTSESQLLAEAVKPDQAKLAKLLSSKIHEIIDKNYLAHREDVKQQIENIIKTGFENSEQMKKLGNIPLVGGKITSQLEDLLSDVSFQLMDSLSSKLASEEIAQIVENMINTTLNTMFQEQKDMKATSVTDDEIGLLMTRVVDRILEQVKQDIEKGRKTRFQFRRPVEEQ